MRRILLLALVILFWPIATGRAQEERRSSSKTTADIEFFEKRIRPVLVAHCYECHAAGADDVGGNLRLDSRTGWLEGGDLGPAVVPEKPGQSLLIDALEYGSLEMPPDRKLPEHIIADFRRWVASGAPDPRTQPRPDPKPDSATAARPLWSLQPLASVTPPELENPNWIDADWPLSPIDRFVIARLEDAGLESNPVADSVALLRRLSVDLVGLPPRPAHLERMLRDDSLESWERIVDELIDSPQFGERWARHWLDVARYAESAGSSRDVLMTTAWKYRNYVIDAYNADMSYAQFVTEQIAGDLMPADSPEERRRQQIATGFLAVGQKSLNGGNLPLDIADDQIDVLGKSVLGLTVSCARCHDHKFDPIPTQDYYSLAGIFLSTETRYGGGTKRPKNTSDMAKEYLPLADDQLLIEFAKLDKRISQAQQKRGKSAKQVQALKRKLPKDWQQRSAELNEKSDATEETVLSADDQSLLEQVSKFREASASMQQLDSELVELREKQSELGSLEFAVGVRESKTASDAKVRVRGEKNQLGEIAPRGFLTCIPIDQQQVLEAAQLPPIDDRQSGRLQLAAWLTATDNPLTARVAVNRIWFHLTGRGLVPTIDNFGVNGTAPTHPELLDYLAQRFMQNDWSTKRLVRDIVLSRTYRLSTDHNEHSFQIDPAGQLYWRGQRRRLEAEVLHDALLMAGDELLLRRPDFGSTVAQIGEGEVGRNLNTKPLDEVFPYRGVYLPIIRGLLPESLRLFDYPDPSNPRSQRDATNVPAQSLFFMNSPLVIRQAEQAASALFAEGGDRQERIQAAFRRILSRPAAKPEVQRIAAFLDHSLEPTAQPNHHRLQAAWTSVCQSLFATAEFRVQP